MDILEIIDDRGHYVDGRFAGELIKPFPCPDQRCTKVFTLLPCFLVHILILHPQVFQPQIRPSTSLPDTHQRAALRVQYLRKGLYPTERLDCSLPYPHRGKAPQVRIHWLRKMLLRRKLFHSQSTTQANLFNSHQVSPATEEYTPGSGLTAATLEHAKNDSSAKPPSQNINKKPTTSKSRPPKPPPTSATSSAQPATPPTQKAPTPKSKPLMAHQPPKSPLRRYTTPPPSAAPTRPPTSTQPTTVTTTNPTAPALSPRIPAHL